MAMTLLISLVLTGTTVALVFRAVAMPRIGVLARLGQIEAYGFAADAPIAAAEVNESASIMDRLALAVGGWVVGRWKAFDDAEIRKTLTSAGLYTTTPMMFLGYRALAGIAFPLTFAWYMTATGASGGSLIGGLGLGIYAGWRVPMLIVDRRARRRFDSVERDLPELIDLLTVTVEAGLSFTSALQVVGAKMKGPLGDEVRLTLQEQRMGLSTNEALGHMLERCDTPSMRSFVRSVLQGETLGVSIGQILRALAVEMRKRRRASAEERAQKAPIKMLFPLILLIFPSLFIVLLFPAIYSFMATMGGS